MRAVFLCPRHADTLSPDLLPVQTPAGASGRRPPSPIPGAWGKAEDAPARRSAGEASVSGGRTSEDGSSARKESGSVDRAPRKASPAPSPAETTPDRPGSPAEEVLPVPERVQDTTEVAGAAGVGDQAEEVPADPALFSYVPYPPWFSPRSTLFPVREKGSCLHSSGNYAIILLFIVRALLVRE